MNDLMRANEVARLFGVDPKTVTRWANEGRLPFIRTLGGHRRYPREAVMAMLRGELPTEDTHETREGAQAGTDATASAD